MRNAWLASVALWALGCSAILGIDEAHVGDGGGADVTDAAAVDAALSSITVSIIDKPGLWTNTDDELFTFEASEEAQGFECRMEGEEDFAVCESPKIVINVEGSNLFEVRALDLDGIAGPIADHAWTRDSMPPVSSITDTSMISGSTAILGFSISDNYEVDLVECALNSTALFEECDTTTSHTFTEIGDGLHTFFIRATDIAGNVEDPAVSTQFIIDTGGPPDTFFSNNPDSTPSNPSNDETPEFEFESTKPAEGDFRCVLDGTIVNDPCVSPFEVGTPLTAGEHTFTVAARDSGNQIDPVPASYTWTVDLTPPFTTFSVLPSALEASSDATFVFSSSEPNSTFTCRLDSEPVIDPCTLSDGVLTGLSEGLHSFLVTATDEAGNAELISSGSSIDWIVDTVDPTTTIMAQPSNPSPKHVDQVVFSADETATFICDLDGSAAACTSPFAMSELTAGAHSLTITATDSAGNLSLETINWDVGITMFASSLTEGLLGTAGGRTGADELCLTNQLLYTDLTGLSVGAFMCISSGDKVGDMPASHSVPTGLPLFSLSEVQFSPSWAHAASSAVQSTSLLGAGILSAGDRAWIGCTANGNANPSICQGWTSNSAAEAGEPSRDSSYTSTGWMSGGAATCNQDKPILCVAY